MKLEIRNPNRSAAIFFVVGTSRCDVPARVQRAERIGCAGAVSEFACAASERGADGAARHPCLTGWHHQHGPIIRSFRAFTLIELILVMAILTVAVSITAPTLGHFFSGRALDSEARRLLSLIRAGQSRAVSEGLPMELWFDPVERRYVLEAETSSRTGGSDTDSKRVELSLDRDVKLAIPIQTIARPVLTRSSMMPASTASVPPVILKQPSLPTIRFLPDGSFADSSPQSVQLIDRDGASLWLALSRNRMNYEIRTQID